MSFFADFTNGLKYGRIRLNDSESIRDCMNERVI